MLNSLRIIMHIIITHTSQSSFVLDSSPIIRRILFLWHKRAKLQTHLRVLHPIFLVHLQKSLSMKFSELQHHSRKRQSNWVMKPKAVPCRLVYRDRSKYQCLIKRWIVQLSKVGGFVTKDIIGQAFKRLNIKVKHRLMSKIFLKNGIIKWRVHLRRQSLNHMKKHKLSKHA